MRFIALTDGASCGVSDNACSLSTCSSEGTPIVTMTAIANHAKMMSTENRWIVRATNGCAVCSAFHVFAAHADFNKQEVKAFT